MSLVSVILAVYNCEQYIRKTVDSLLSQTHTEIEILICDDSSTDRTWNVLKEYKDDRIKICRNEVNRGVVYSRNSLLKKATGSFIVIQDGDDWSDSDRIKIQLDVFEKDKAVGACGVASYRVDNKGAIIVEKLKQESFYISIDDCMTLPFMPATLMLRREVYENVGGYHSYFSDLFAEDLYWILLIAEKYSIFYLNQPLYYYRFNPDSITNTVGKKEKLVVLDLMQQLIDQRKQSGSDWISNGDKKAINKFISGKFDDRKWLSEKYRITAAVQRDGGKRKLALKIIFKAIAANPFSFRNYITLRYIIFF